MGLEIITDFVANHIFLVGFLLVVAAVIWKLIIQPILNEGKPINPTKKEREAMQKKKFNFKRDIMDFDELAANLPQ